MNIKQLYQQRYGLDTNYDAPVEVNETISNIMSRRSQRAFQQKPVPADLLNALFATAFSAPSKSDLQQACVIHVKDRAKQTRITRLSEKTSWAALAPVFLVWCGDSRRIRKLADWRGHEFANDHLDAFMNAAVDTGICMQTFIVAAESFGLGCCPVSEIRDNIDALSAELELPQHVFPVAGLCVGWPQQEGRISLRLPLSVTTHQDYYDDSDLINQVQAYDQRREKLDQTPAEQQRLAERFGVADDYGWSENRTRQYSLPARDDFGSYIRKQGFKLD